MVTAAMAAYVPLRAFMLGLPLVTQLRMWVNVGFDAAVGTVPVVGDFADTLFKCNRRNVDHVLAYFGRQTLSARQ
jgi:hypothetical protein